MTKDVASSPALRDGLLPAMSVALSEKPSPVSVPRPTPIALESLENNKRTINDIISAGSPVVASNWVVELPRSIKSIKTNRNPAPSNVKTSSSPALHTDITARTPPVGSTGSQVVASHGIAVRPCPTPITSQAAVSPSPPSTNAIPFRSLPLIPSTSSTNSPVYKKTIMSLVAQAAKAASQAAAAADLAAQASQSCSKLATQASFGLCQDKTPFFPV